MAGQLFQGLPASLYGHNVYIRMRNELYKAASQGLVVLDDQQTFYRTPDIALDLQKCGLQFSLVAWFLPECERSYSKALLVLVGSRDDMHRNMPQLRAAFQAADDRPAVEHRQMQIQQDGIRLVSMSQGQTLVTFEGDNGFEASASGQPQQYSCELGILFNNEEQGISILQIIAVILHFRVLQQLGIGDGNVGYEGFTEGRTRDHSGSRIAGCGSFFACCCLKGCAWQGGGIFSRIHHRQNQGEGAAFAFRGIHLDPAFQQGRQLAADGQAEAGSPIFAAGCAVGLLESFEYALQLGGGNADSGIADSQDNVFSLGADREGDRAVLRCEFDRIGQQIIHNLLKPVAIGQELFRQSAVAVDLEADLFLFGQLLEMAVQMAAEVSQ
ncbi:hypothetical protein D3C74_310740 [compost metagenome]